MSNTGPAYMCTYMDNHGRSYSVARLLPGGAGIPDKAEVIVHIRRSKRTYRSGGLRRSRSVRKYTDRLIRARIAAAMAPAHQYQAPSVTAATIKPAASTTSVLASPSRHHRGNPELTL